MGTIDELARVEAEEREARERLEAHRAKILETEGVAPRSEDHLVLQQLERDWKRAAERLRGLRRTSKG